MSKRLYKKSDEAMIAGGCAGLAEYLGVDATLIRLAFVILTFMGGSGLFAYLIAAIVMPEKGLKNGRWQPTGDDGTFYDATTVDTGTDGEPKSKSASMRSNTQALLAYILIGIGSYMLIDRYVNWYRIVRYIRPYWPVLLIVIGIGLLLNSSRKA
ncbi:MAG: PspC domain-containing protein [Firmicutes bacterium]|nr:PspC domain-containing protein [Bacillota bacterium]